MFNFIAHIIIIFVIIIAWSMTYYILVRRFPVIKEIIGDFTK